MLEPREEAHRDGADDTPPSGTRSKTDRLLEVVLELAAAARMPQLAEGLGLDLADPLARDVEVAPDLLESAGSPVLEPEAELQDASLTRRQRVQAILHLLLLELVGCLICRRHRGEVRDEVTEVAVLLLADRRLQADRLLRDLHDLAHLLRADRLRPIGHALVDLGLGWLALELVAQLADDLVTAHAPRDLLDVGLAAQLLEQRAADADEPVDRLDHVDRDADRACLVGDGARDRLTDPPRRIRAELEALLVVELLDRSDEADVALLDEVQEAHAATDVLLGDADHQAQVGLGQALARIGALLHQAAGPLLERHVERDGRVVAEAEQVLGVVATGDVLTHD